MTNKITQRLNQSLLMISVLTLLIALFWAFIGINLALNKTEKPVVSQKEINPIKLGLDKETIEALRNKSE